MRRALIAVLLGAIACAEPTTPARSGSYPFALNGTVFHWPADRLPVRFYAVPAGNLPSLVQHSVTSWSGQFLYGEFTGVLVTDSTRADVVVAWSGSAPPDVPPDTGTAVAACDGVTTIPPVDSATRGYSAPFHVTLSVLSGFTAAQVGACVRRVATHELGHTLGLFQHSPDPGDIMFAQPVVTEPSEHDRNTVELLYHSLSSVGPPP
jgi:hypothetical protein